MTIAEAAAPSTELRLFGPQDDALFSRATELLIGGPVGPCGTSFGLRAAGIILAAQNEGIEVLLAHQSAEALRKTHVEGDSGIIALVADMQRHGACIVTPTEVRFASGGILRWSGLGRDAEVRRATERRVDVLLVDDVETMPEPLYARLRDHAMNSPYPVRRTIAASTGIGSAGWVDRYWTGLAVAGREFMLFAPGDLDPELVRAPEQLSYRDFFDNIHAGSWVWTPLVEHVTDHIERWVKGEWEHLAIFMPSQHGKTELGPRNCIPYILHLHPTDWCCVTSYGSDLANSRSQDARANFIAAGGGLQHGRKKINEWHTVNGGGCWSAGMSAGQAGKSSNWVFLDDGDMEWEDAVNKTKQSKKRRRYTSVLRDRESMYAAEQREQKVCITATRWDPEDINGYALSKGHEAGERWCVLVLPALYDPTVRENYQRLYPNFTIAEDFRTEIGEALWEERRSAVKWEKWRILKGPRIFETESQQNALGVEKGEIFWASWFRRIDRDPSWLTEETNEGVYAECCRAWDLAATAGGGDFTAGTKMGRTTDDEIIVRHSIRAQLSPTGVEHLIACAAILDGPTVTIRIPVDPAAGGVASATSIGKYVHKVFLKIGMPCPPIVAERPRRLAHATLSAKAARARDLQSFAQPLDWNRDAETHNPGAVSFVGEAWEPAVSDVVPRYAEIVRDWPELATIAKMAKYIRGTWWNPWLQTMEGFTGEDGCVDDEVDSTVDAFDQTRYHEASYGAVIQRR